jgi:hypothetical protein
MNQEVAVVIIMVSLAAVGLLAIAIFPVEAASYKAVIKIKFADSCFDSVYARISDSKANPKTGEHDTLVGKFTVENPKHTLLSVEKSFKFDPKKVPSGFLREYINLENNDKVFYQDYKHPYTAFDKKRSTYTFTHQVPRLC